MEFKRIGTLTGAKLGSVGLILAGIVLLVNPDFGSGLVAKVLGWGVLGVSALTLATAVWSWPSMGFGTMGGGCLGVLLGLYILRNPLMLASVLGIALGIFLAGQGLGALGDALRLRRLDAGWKLPAVLAGATLLLGAYLIFFPLSTSRLVMNLAGIVMILCGGGNLVTHFRAAHWAERSGDSGIIDADD